MKRLHYLLALALLAGAGPGALAIEPVDGVYHIGSTQDFVEFAAVVNSGAAQVDAVLEADIDLTSQPRLTLGAARPYPGTFDGRRHTVTLALSVEGECCALFKELSGTVRDLTVKGTVDISGKYGAGVAGRMYGTAAMTGVVSDVTLNSSVENDGTLGGLAGVINDNASVTFTNCAFTGAIRGSGTTCTAGFAGWCASTSTALLNGCLFIADVSETGWTDCDSFVRNSSYGTYINCVYTTKFVSAPADATQVTPEQLRNGAACYALNGRSSANPAWRQTLGTDTVPTLDPAAGVVYAVGRFHCDGTSYAGGGSFANSAGGTQTDAHDYQDGVCSFCGEPDTAWMRPAGDGWYEVGSAAQLVWAAAMVNFGFQPDLRLRLTAPIDLEGAASFTVGTAAIPFRGSYDGCFQPITHAGAPLIGTGSGCDVTRVALESGDISGFDSRLGAHVGSIMCEATTKVTLSDSWSRTTLTVNDGCDCGGLVGKYRGTIRNCAFLGTLANAGTGGGIAGSDDGSKYNYMDNCLVNATLNPLTADNKGTVMGWNSYTKINNCVAIAAPEGFADFVKGGKTSGVYVSGCKVAAAADFASGSVAWDVNSASFPTIIWRQTLGQDQNPTVLAGSAVVYKLADGSCTNSLPPYAAEVAGALAARADTVVAYKPLVDSLRATLPALTEWVADHDTFTVAYRAAHAMLDKVDASARAYAAYRDAMRELVLFSESNELSTPEMGVLDDYVSENAVAPCETFPNGNIAYIMTECPLTVEQLRAETQFALDLLDAARKSDYQPGADVTALLVNADLANGFGGWVTKSSGGNFCVGGVAEVMPVGEGWNNTFDVHQTITGVKNGVYELRAHGAFRAGPIDQYYGNDNYAGYFYAGDNIALIQSVGEDMLPAAEAVDSVNCDKGTDDYQEMADAYVPNGLVGASRHFSDGRYLNRVVCRVTNDTLTVGVANPGTGAGRDWCSFADFRLIYLGQDEAADSLGAALDFLSARAETLINYEADNGNFTSCPNFSSALREELREAVEDAQKAGDTESMMAAAARFTDLFRRVYSCKQAYVALAQKVIDWQAKLDADQDAPDEWRDEFYALFEDMLVRWQEGSYTEEEALGDKSVEQTAFYRNFFVGAPDMKDGVFQLATADDMLWFSRHERKFSALDKAELTAPVDMSGVAWEPIGDEARPFAGSFEGHLLPITGMTKSLFGATDGARVSGVAIVGGEIAGDAAYAPHTGSIIGLGAATQLTRSYSTAHIAQAEGDAGGLVGKMKAGSTVSDCCFAGNVDCGGTAGGVAGSSDGSSCLYVKNTFVDARNVTYWNGNYHGVFAGWLHGSNIGKWDNNYYIAAPELTNLFGNQKNSYASASQVSEVTPDEAASGMVCHKLNKGGELAPVWRQTLGEDDTPVLLEDHMVVCLREDGTYYNVTGGDAVRGVTAESRLADGAAVYDLGGRLVRRGSASGTRLEGLPSGLYIIGGRKVLK